MSTYFPPQSSTTEKIEGMIFRPSKWKFMQQGASNVIRPSSAETTTFRTR